jgi:hypothetical protein
MAYVIGAGNPHYPGVYAGIFTGAMAEENFARTVENSRVTMERRRVDLEEARLVAQERDAAFRRRLAEKQFAAQRDQIAAQATQWRSEFGLRAQQERRLSDTAERGAALDESRFGLETTRVEESVKTRQEQSARLQREEERAGIEERNDLRGRGFRMSATAAPGKDEVEYVDRSGTRWVGRAALAREVEAQNRHRAEKLKWYRAEELRHPAEPEDPMKLRAEALGKQADRARLMHQQARDSLEKVRTALAKDPDLQRSRRDARELVAKWERAGESFWPSWGDVGKRLEAAKAKLRAIESRRTAPLEEKRRELRYWTAQMEQTFGEQMSALGFGMAPTLPPTTKEGRLADPADAAVVTAIIGRAQRSGLDSDQLRVLAAIEQEFHRGDEALALFGLKMLVNDMKW